MTDHCFRIALLGQLVEPNLNLEGIEIPKRQVTEPYQSGEKECLRPSYFQHPETWDTLPSCRATAESLTVTKRFECLDAGQLLKHILGLTRTFGQRGFILLYLWYEVEGSEASDQHRAEVVEFSSLISTEVQFRGETYQRFFSRNKAAELDDLS